MLKNILLLLPFIFMVACSDAKHDLIPEDPEALNQKTIPQLLLNPEQILFADVERLVLKPSCVECHSTDNRRVESKINLMNYETTKGNKTFNPSFISFNAEQSPMYKVLIIPSGSLHMPPIKKPQLSKEQINLVFQWIQNGAKENPSQVIERPKSLTEKLDPYFKSPQTIDYNIVKEHVFDPSCTKCHSTESPQHEWEATSYGQNMTTYSDLFKSEKPFSTDGIVKGQLLDKWVTDNEAENCESGERKDTMKKIRGSRIFTSAVVYQSMPPAADGYEPLSGLQAKLLRLWILNCAIGDYEAIKEDDNLNDSAIEKKSSKVRICN